MEKILWCGQIRGKPTKRPIKNFGTHLEGRSQVEGGPREEGKIWIPNPNPFLGLAKVKSPTNPNLSIVTTRLAQAVTLAYILIY